MNKEVLIDAVFLLPELYDKNHKDYGNIDHRNQVWETLAEQFGSSVEDIRNKWRNIRDAYQKALKKKAQCIDNNTMELYKAYKYEDQLVFLKHFCSATIKSAKRKNTNQDERYELKLKKLGFYYKSENEEFLQETTDLQEEPEEPHEPDESEEPNEPEELFNCVPFEDQKEYEQSVDDINSLEPIVYEECNEDVEDKENFTDESTPVLESSKHNFTNAISVTKEADEASKNVMSNFFLTVCSTVSTLPVLMQAKIKKQVFDIVCEAEIAYLTELSNFN